MPLTISAATMSTAGVLLLAIVLIEWGGYFMLSLARGRRAATPFQVTFARAGHAHAGVLVILSLADIVEESLDETGAGEIREGHEQIVARLDPTSKVKRRETAQLWADTAKLHLFDPESGESLRADAKASA